MQVGKLRILTAQLDDDIGVRILAAGHLGLRNDLLHKRHIQLLRQCHTARPGESWLHFSIAKFPTNVLEELRELSPHVSVVSAVVTEDRLLSIEHHGLHSRRANIDPEFQHVHSPSTHAAVSRIK